MLKWRPIVSQRGPAVVAADDGGVARARRNATGAAESEFSRAEITEEERNSVSLKFDQRRPKILGRWFAHHDNGLPTTQIKLILAHFYNLSWLRSRLLLLASPPAGAKMNMR